MLDMQIKTGVSRSKSTALKKEKSRAPNVGRSKSAKLSRLKSHKDHEAFRAEERKLMAEVEEEEEHY
jgi:hypothetical protein